MKGNGKRTLLRVGAAIFALLFAVSMIGTVLTQANASKVHGFLGTVPTKIVSDGDGGKDYFTSDYSAWEDQYAHAEELIKRIQEEGSVLLENNGALPLANGAKVSLFSRSSTNIVYTGTGSGSMDESQVPTLRAALEQGGFAVNGTLWDFYAGQSGYARTTSDIAEIPLSDYTDAVKASYADYNDAAIVVISRAGGEGDDPDKNVAYLELQDAEKDLLAHVQENFETIIVLVNSSNAVSLNWLNDYGVDACLWIGGPGSMTGRRYYHTNPNDATTATSVSAIGYNSSAVIGSTWSQSLAYERGVSIGEDGLWTNTEGWWGPGANTHRTPYSGRNFEYYSEDAYLGGQIAANDVTGAQSKGMRAFIKHFAMNDQELNRHGVATFSNEQAMREIYLKQFQYIVQEGGTLSLMESFNRVGCNWAGGYYALCTELLRNEWGFLGSVLSDFNFHDDTGWMNTRSGLRGGTDQWLSIGPSGLLGFAQSDVDTAYEIRQACHRILYAVVQTAAMNGMDETSRVVKVTAWWETLLLVCNIAFGVLTLLCLIGVIVTRKKAGQENGAGFILGIVASALAIVGIVGCIMIGGLTKEICLLTLGVVLFAVAVKLGSNLLVYLPYACYLGAGCLFLSDELYTISNVLTAIDANTFSTGFKVAAVGIVGTIIVMLIATICPLKKEQQ